MQCVDGFSPNDLIFYEADLKRNQAALSVRTVTAMEHIGSVMGYHFRNEHLVEDALDLSGLRPNQANRRLALIGDMVLRSAILDDWYPTTRAYRYGIRAAAEIQRGDTMLTAASGRLQFDKRPRRQR